MIVNNNFKSIEIDIITYQRVNHCSCVTSNMNDSTTDNVNRKNNSNRFICSICLNKRQSHEENRSVECCKRISKSCPICQRNCETEGNKITTDSGYKKVEGKSKGDTLYPDATDINGRNMYMQTSQADVAHGLSLLNEVLTVFQSKKQMDSKNYNKNKTVILKDANVAADIKKIPKLTSSRTFIYNLEENCNTRNQNGKFSIIDCYPDTSKLSQFSIDLIKHKSSSIPQMKLEELKNTFKEKTKSKDAVEEVNRMFATVRKHESRERLDDSNRPMIRHGPRVLPVVKTNITPTDIKNKIQGMQICRHCQTCNHMSSGDCWHKPNICENCCKSCVYCNNHALRKTEAVCQECYDLNKEC